MARAGCDVTFVDRWEEHVQAINEHGMYVDGARGEHRIEVPAFTPDQLEKLAPLDTVIVAVKSHDTRGALEQLLPYSTPETAFVSMQAGMNLPIFEEIVGGERTVGADPNYGGALVDPGHVEAGFPNYIWIGELDGSFTPRLRQLQLDLNNWTPTLMTDNIRGTVWSKFAFGSQIVLSALSEQKLASRSQRLVAGAMVREAIRVADALDLELQHFDFFDPDPYRVEDADDTDGVLLWIERAWPRHDVFRQHGHHDYVKTGSGMRWDILYRKRASETTAMMDALRREAERAGVEIPLNLAVLRIIREIESGQRSMTDENFDELSEIIEEEGASLPV
jgi:2-dehydropantoate 2-reductase